MFWRILPHASACIASGTLMLLDVRQDRYFRVPPAGADEMAAWLERSHPCAPPKAVLETLARARICRSGDPDPTNALRERAVVPSQLMQFPRAREVRAGLVRVAGYVAIAWAMLRVRPLNHILAGRSALGPLPLQGRLEAAREAAAAFERARALVPIARNCLLDSLALSAWLARRGHGSQLVFGVSPEPFAAHCWLQTPEVLLNDSYDHVSRFAPILAI